VKAQPLKPAWNAGELSPRLGARTDFDKYKNGAEVLENMIPLSEMSGVLETLMEFDRVAKQRPVTV